MYCPGSWTGLLVDSEGVVIVVLRPLQQLGQIRIREACDGIDPVLAVRLNVLNLLVLQRRRDLLDAASRSQTSRSSLCASPPEQLQALSQCALRCPSAR